MLKINNQTNILLKPFDLIETDKGLLLKRGAKFLWIKDPIKIESFKYFYFCLSNSSIYENILEKFACCFEQKLLYEIINRLNETNMIKTDNTDESDFSESEVIFFEQLGLSISSFYKNLMKKPILILGERNLLSDQIENIFCKYNVNCCRTIEYIPPNMDVFIQKFNPSLIIMMSLDGKADKLLKYNKLLKKKGTNFLPLILRDAFCYIGPLSTESGPCFECSIQRYNANHLFMSKVYSQAKTGIYPLADHAATFIAAMIFQLYINSLTTLSNNANKVIEMNINTFSVSPKSFLISPGCSICSNMYG